MNYIVPQESLNAIARYLMERPFKEVAPLIQAIQQCKPEEVKAPEAKRPYNRKEKSVEKTEETKA